MSGLYLERTYNKKQERLCEGVSQWLNCRILSNLSMLFTDAVKKVLKKFWQFYRSVKDLFLDIICLFFLQGSLWSSSSSVNSFFKIYRNWYSRSNSSQSWNFGDRNKDYFYFQCRIDLDSDEFQFISTKVNMHAISSGKMEKF